MRIFQYIVFFFAVLSQTSTVAAQTSLTLDIGDVRLPSGTVIRSPDLPVTADAYKRLLQQQFDAMSSQLASGSAQKLVEGMAKKTAGLENWTTKLEVVSRRRDYALQLICDEYVGYVLQPKMRPLPRNSKLKKAIIEISDAKDGLSKKCEYGIKKGIALIASDGVMLPRKAYKFFDLDLGSSGKLLTTYLTLTRRIDVQKILADVFIVVPVAVSDTAKLGEYLTAAAQKLYALKDSQHFLIRFQALTAGSKRGRYRFPGRSVMAFQSSDGRIVLVNEIKYRFLNLRGKDGKIGSMQEYVEVLAMNPNFSKALAAGVGALAGGPLTQYVKDGIYADSRYALDAAGRYAAKVFGTKKVVVVSKEQFPGRRQGMRIPVSYELKGEDWVVANRKKQ